ncbi:GMC family oxidoreductase [Rubeoparvulum massiliense]|uniref:GMC family oxidoreductase n=1 Tax=Rubeoparvulum massiliense TaxID=1631346 RepID=UPI00065E209C|nr:GMC family oxidoreductase [Rubeoparvulum massiliense]
MLKRKYANEEVDVLIIGAGAAGGVLAKELAEANLKVVVLEAGPFRDPQKDFASDELSMKRLGWEDTRLVAGKNPLTMGHNNSGRGVGGGTVHFTGVFLRFQDIDFRARTMDGVAWDWPISYEDLEPYYTQIEQEIAVSGPKHFPWGHFHGPYPYPERHPLSPNADLFMNGCEKLGIQATPTPLAILSAPYDGRPPCINRGFCNQGCMPNAKFSTLIHHIPKAMKAGAEVLADCMVTQILLDQDDKVRGVTFVHDGITYEQSARIVILSAYAIESPRLLLHSATTQYPQGLANTSGWVGKGLMTHSSHDVYAKFADEVRLYKGTPVLASTLDFYRTDASRGFVRGYTIHAHGVRPVAMAQGLARTHGLWGEKLQQVMLDYNFYGRLTMVGEVLPQVHNSVTLADEVDEYGIPRARVSFSYSTNDERVIQHGVATMSTILEAAGGKVEYVVDDTAHLMGGCRMGEDPEDSVVDGYCQSHDHPNLFICDASVFVTSGAGNPTNTVMAIALRTAEYIKKHIRSGQLPSQTV